MFETDKDTDFLVSRLFNGRSSIGVTQNLVHIFASTKNMQITGCPTKHYPLAFCLLSLAKIMLESWDIIHWKDGSIALSGVQKLFCKIFGSRDISKLKWGIRFPNV